MRLNIDIYFLVGTTEEFLIETTKVANPLQSQTRKKDGIRASIYGKTGPKNRWIHAADGRNIKGSFF